MRKLLLISAAAIGLASGFMVHAYILQQRQWALSRAAGDGDLTAVKRHVEAGADLDTAPVDWEGAVYGIPALTCAALQGHEEIVCCLLDCGANPNLHGMSNPLIAACWKRHYGIAKMLLEHGVDPNARGEGTPMFAAEDQPELIELLLRHGAKATPTPN